MASCWVARPLLPVLAFVLAALVPTAAVAQLPPVLHPGDHHRFVGADVDAELGPGCDGVVNGCGVDYGDLGVDSPRMYISSVVNVGVLGTTRTATGRLAHPFSLSPGADHLITAKLIGVVTWRGWLQADFGAYDNTSGSEIGVSIYDVTDPSRRRLVANQMVHTNSVSGSISEVPSFERDFGRAGFDLVVNLQRGRAYLAAVEATCTSTSGLLGLFAASSYSTFGRGRTALTDGYIEQTSMSITLDPDYLALIDELRDDFEHHTHTYLTGRGVGHNNTEAVTSGPIDSVTAGGAPGVGGNGVDAPSLSMLTAAPDRVELSAWLPSGAESPILERRTGESEWSRVSELHSGGAFVDGSVVAGVRYGYRLRAVVSGAEITSDELWVEVPVHVLLGLEGARPNPIAGQLRVMFSLPSRAPATLSLYDVLGREVMTREVGAMGIGRHSLEWASANPLANGIYVLRLTQTGQSVTSKVALLR